MIELELLGDISIAVPVTIFDNGHHTSPVPHEEPFAGTLIFTPGTLLRIGRGQIPTDWAEARLPDGRPDHEGYYCLYQRRMLPVLQHGMPATGQGKLDMLTIPSLGSGQFAR